LARPEWQTPALGTQLFTARWWKRLNVDASS
jgi:hypothetical protein